MPERLPSAAELHKMKKEDLVKLLQERENPGGERQDTMTMVLEEMRMIKDEIKKSNEIVMTTLRRMDALEEEVKDLKQEKEELVRLLESHQTFLESVDSKERQCNIIVTGLRENSDAFGENDKEKVAKILENIGASVDPERVKSRRLGKLDESREMQKRTLLMSLPDKETRDDILTKAKELKKYKGVEQQQISKVYLKKDVHPMWRKEKERLQKVVRDEKKKAINAGVEIKYDHKRRAVLRDGQVIDKFQPQI